MRAVYIYMLLPKPELYQNRFWVVQNRFWFPKPALISFRFQNRFWWSTRTGSGVKGLPPKGALRQNRFWNVPEPVLAYGGPSQTGTDTEPVLVLQNRFWGWIHYWFWSLSRTGNGSPNRN